MNRVNTVSERVISGRTFASTNAGVIKRTPAPRAKGGLVLPGTLTGVGLILPPGLSFEEWQAAGETLRSIRGAVAWATGDWWLQGERDYGEMAAQATKDAVEDATGHDYRYISTAAWVASRFEFSRRHENLSFGHHQAVAALDPEMADALLERAEAAGLTRTELRAVVRALKTPAEQEPAVVCQPAAAESASATLRLEPRNGTAESRPKQAPDSGGQSLLMPEEMCATVVIAAHEPEPGTTSERTISDAIRPYLDLIELGAARVDLDELLAGWNGHTGCEHCPPERLAFAAGTQLRLLERLYSMGLLTPLLLLEGGLPDIQHEPFAPQPEEEKEE